jgi:hypothetical protein
VKEETMRKIRIRIAALAAAQTRRLVLALVVLVALAASSGALAAGEMAGKYTATINTPDEIEGKWILTLGPRGSYSVKWDGMLVARGKYSATAKTITLGPERGHSGCAGSGTYAYKKVGKTVSFTRKREAPSCGGRAAVLAHPFKKVR